MLGRSLHPHGYGLEEADLDRVRRTLDVNIIGALAMTQSVIPAMKDTGRGSIIMISTSGVRQPAEGFGPHRVSKAGLLLATQTLALELGGYGIRVNSVMPGYIWGPAVQNHFRAEAARRGVDPQESQRSDVSR